MKTHRQNKGSKREAMACAMALVVLCVAGVLAAAFVSQTSLNLRSGANERLVVDSRFAAESGLAFMLHQVRQFRLPGNTTQEDLPEAMAAAIGNCLNDTDNLGGQLITLSDGVVSVPEIHIGGVSFTARFSAPGADICRLEVTGISGSVSRRIAIDMTLRATNSAVFETGLATKGSLSILGNAEIIGVDDPTEASVFMVNEDGTATIGGNATVSGDVYSSGPGSSVLISGNPSIGECTGISAIMKHVHTSVTPPVFPEADTEPLASLATTTLNASSNINVQGLVLDNVRIASGANLNFAKDVVLNGIVVIEAPNSIKFESKVTVNGMIITVGAAGQPIENCNIRFAGQVEANGVEVLPDEPQYADVKEQTGTFILAPGFGVSFAGQFTAISGTMAADQLTFTGQAEGTVTGAVIGLADYPTTVDGNVTIRVKQADTDYNPAGFVKCLALTPDSVTYTELVGH